MKLDALVTGVSTSLLIWSTGQGKWVLVALCTVTIVASVTGWFREHGLTSGRKNRRSRRRRLIRQLAWRACTLPSPNGEDVAALQILVSRRKLT